MNKKFARIITTIKYAGFFIPFSVYFVVFAACYLIITKLVSPKSVDTNSSFSDVIVLLVNVAGWFAAIFIFIALLTVLISFFYFLFYKRKGTIQFKISTELTETQIDNKQQVKLFISPVLKPLMGYVKLRLLYDDNQFSNKFSLIENNRESFFNTTIQGIYMWKLPQIKEYHIDKAILYYEDIFRFFSIAVSLPVQNSFITQPLLKELDDLKSQPRKTEETNTRIEQLKRVDGEYLNYKNFENNDDVRRIVWKIYAKNKELVVRIPEIIDPYASHIYMYPSFFSTFNYFGNSAIEGPFLNYFKTMIWSIYTNLSKRGYNVKYIPDQDISQHSSAVEEQLVKYAISTSKLHKNKSLKSFVKTGDASVVIISSLSDPHEVRELMEQSDHTISFVFIKLTDSLKKQRTAEWIQWLFIANEDNDLDVQKRNWALSPLRTRIQENEKQLEKIISKELEVTYK